jgi:hypothetical protein
VELEQRHVRCVARQRHWHHQGGLRCLQSIVLCAPRHARIITSCPLQARKSKEEQLKQLQTVTPTPATQQIHADKVKSLSDAIAALDSAAAAAKESAQRSLVSSVRVLQRHHFSSALQRMSVVVHCQGREPYSGLYCLVKGSPEALLPLMDPTKLPSWYFPTWLHFATLGVFNSPPPQVYIVLRVSRSQGPTRALFGLQARGQRACRRRVRERVGGGRAHVCWLHRLHVQDQS